MRSTSDAQAWQLLLGSLDREPSRAAARYEQLRRRLIGLFQRHGVARAEDHADATFDRAAMCLARGVVVRGDVSAFVIGVARHIAFEAVRSARREHLFDPSDPASAIALPPAESDDEDQLASLARCLDTLPPSTRALLLRYDEGAGTERIAHRKALASELGIPLNALRIRVHRLRARLAKLMSAFADA
jgi:DNA-directed RNA polymerase specialized sigma24 family protein